MITDFWSIFLQDKFEEFYSGFYFELFSSVKGHEMMHMDEIYETD